MKRYSRQREVIMQDLMNRKDHPTAEMVYQSVPQEIPNISLGTVYRNLKTLSEEEVILSFSHDGKEHFDADKKPHIHLCCSLCGRIWDNALAEIDLSFVKDQDFMVSNVIVQGICKECRMTLH